MAEKRASRNVAGPKKVGSGGGDARDPEAARKNILDAATEEFSKKGLSGARVDEIAERTNTVKRMIYYYFESKEGLYRAVLERAYEEIRSLEESLQLDTSPPVTALRTLVGATFDYHNEHPDFVRLVMNENIHHGDHIGQLSIIKARKGTVVGLIQALLDRGTAERVFRDGLDAIDVHMSISALCFYNVSNKYTFSQIFERDMSSPRALKRRRQIVIDTIERWIRRV